MRCRYRVPRISATKLDLASVYLGRSREQRAGEALAGEDRGPFLERQVRGDHGGAVFVALAEDVEQELASGLRQGHVSELVDDQQFHLGELVLEAEQPFLVARLDHLMGHLGGGGEADGEALLAGGQAEGQSDVRLAHAARAQQDRVLAAVDVVAVGEIQHQHLVERRDRLEVEALELFDDGEAGLPDAPLDQPAVTVDHLHPGCTARRSSTRGAGRRGRSRSYPLPNAARAAPGGCP